MTSIPPQLLSQESCGHELLFSTLELETVNCHRSAKAISKFWAQKLGFKLTLRVKAVLLMDTHFLQWELRLGLQKHTTEHLHC